MRRPTRSTLQVWLIVGLFTLCVAGVAAWLIDRLEREAKRTAQHQAQSLARATESSLNRQFIAFDLRLAGLERLPGLLGDGSRGLDAAKASESLRDMLNQSLLVLDLIVLDAQGRVEVAADEATERLGAGLPDGFFTDVLQQPVAQLRVSTPVTSFRTGEKVVFFARSLGPPGKTRRVAVATVSVSALTTLMAPAFEIDGLSIALENEQGVLLASVPANDSLLGRRHVAPPDASQGTSTARLAPSRLSDAPTYAAVRPLMYPSMLVTAGISEAAARQASKDARLTAVAIAAAFIGLAVAVGALAQTSLARLTSATTETLESKAVLEEALASMDEGFLLCSADNRVVSWNERYLDMFPHMRGVLAPGVALKETVQAAARAMLPDAGEARWQAWITESLARRSSGDEFEQRMPDGRVISSVDRRTATGGTVSIYRDVTLQRAAADELGRSRQAAEAASEAKTRFLATMSHEIRTPLNGVLGMNGLLLHTALDPKQRMYAETIRASGETLLNIINDILDMSRLEAGRMNLESAAFDPVGLIDDVTALLLPRGSAKDISLMVEHGTAMPAQLNGDASRIRQVLFNLVGNAIKFTERGGVVVRTGCKPRGDGRIDWTVSVHDTGIGISAEVMPTLFERFMQADNSTSRRFGGSGLGLAISRELVELMGGRIEVDSRVGEGSEFRVTLPLAAISSAAQDRPTSAFGPRPDALPARTGLRVLVAEDNRVNQILLAAMLEQMGHFADVVANGHEALRQVQETQYDLVLMDIQMPEMDGVSAACAIRRLPGTAGRLPIISISANVLPEQRAVYTTAGMNDHVAKPIDQVLLTAAIVRAVATA